MNAEIEFPAGAVEPIGQRVTFVHVRGVGPVIIDEIYEDFCKRFALFMNEEHARGDQFHFIQFYSWDAEINKLHFKHIKREPGCWTLDGCRDVEHITTEYITVEPLELKPPSALIAPQFAVHGPGKRR